MNAPEYVPLRCDIHDQLEEFAVRREAVRIRFRDPEEAEQEMVGRIVNIWAAGGAEYLRTDDGTTIRLDRRSEVTTVG